MSEKRFTNVSMGREEAYCDFSIIKVGDKIISEIPTNDAIRICDLLNEQQSIIRRDEMSIQTMMSNMKKLEEENKELKAEIEQSDSISKDIVCADIQHELLKVTDENKELKKENEDLREVNKENQRLHEENVKQCERWRKLYEIKDAEVTARVDALNKVCEYYTSEVLFKSDVDPNQAVKEVINEILNAPIYEE